MFKKSKIISFNGGLGDMLILTIIFKNFFDKLKINFSVVTKYPSLFMNLEYLDKVYGPNLFYINFRKFFKTGYHDITYRCWSHLLPEQKQIFNTHVVEQICYQLGLSGKIMLKPDMCFSKSELDSFVQPKSPYIVVQSQASHSNHPQTTKNWGVEKMQEVVDFLGEKFEIIQIGSPKDSRLTGITDYCGKTTIREAGLLLKKSRMFLGLEGALMHMARAVDCPSVIVWGGRLKPYQIGYPCFENVTVDLECSPCWLPNACPKDLECMKRIHPDQVIEASQRILDKTDRSLPVDEILVQKKITPKKMKEEILNFPPHLDHLIEWN